MKSRMKSPLKLVFWFWLCICGNTKPCWRCSYYIVAYLHMWYANFYIYFRYLQRVIYIFLSNNGVSSARDLDACNYIYVDMYACAQTGVSNW
jgi:hypothetical protein